MPPNNAPHNALTAAVNKALADGSPAVVEVRPTRSISMMFDSDGSIEFTRNKALDGMFGGVGVMERVTDIKKLPNDPLFYIKWLMGPYAGKSHDVSCHMEVFDPQPMAFLGRVDSNTGTLMFYSYEDAVNYEIVCLNAMREKGIVFGHDAASA